MLKRKDLISALIMLALGACIIWILIPAGVVEPKKIKYAALSPSYYPRIVAIGLMILGAGLLIRSGLTATDASSEANSHPRAKQRTLIFMLILLSLALTLEWLGFIVASALALAAALILGGEKRLYIILPLAVLFPLALYFFFLKVARIPIPLGILEPLLAGL